MASPTKGKASSLSGKQQEVIRVSDNDFDFGQFYFSYAKYHMNPV